MLPVWVNWEDWRVKPWVRYFTIGSVSGGYGKIGHGLTPDRNTRQWIGTIVSGYGTAKENEEMS